MALCAVAWLDVAEAYPPLVWNILALARKTVRHPAKDNCKLSHDFFNGFLKLAACYCIIYAEFMFTYLLYYGDTFPGFKAGTGQMPLNNIAGFL